MPSENSREPIAIVGIGCRFPGAPNPQAFWKLLREGGDAVREVPAERWNATANYDPYSESPDKRVKRRSGLLDSVDEFDWKAFRIPPREAKYMDPQHRLLLEVAWEALEDAGLPFEEVAGTRTGVYMAIMWNDYLRLQSRDRHQLNGYSNTGNGFAFAPNRISYTFDLKGPSVAVDSACAGSLASVHTACQSLWLGEASLALAGGVNLILSPDVNIMLAKAGVISSAGRCMTLDARADGFVRGEGAGIVVLKPRSQLTSSDRVYAFIRGGAINHNGHNEWIMAASADGQEAALRDAYLMAGVDPAAVDYVELHGTGLPKGDPIEAKALGKVVGSQPGRAHPCAVGSVKSNIGHLDSAAGIASIIKVALSLHHELLPPTLHLQQVNADIPLESLGLVAQQGLGPWPDKTGPSLAGVTAIAMSGVNAHMVLEAAPHDATVPIQPEATGARHSILLPLSAHSPEALLSLVGAVKDHLAREESGAELSLFDLCYTASVRRSHHAHRLALIVHTRSELVESLQAFLQGQPGDGVFYSGAANSDDQETRPDLAEAIERCLRHSDSTGKVNPSRVGEGEERSLMLEALGTLYARGNDLAWHALYPNGGRHVHLPLTSWQRERLWLDWLDAPEQLPNTDDDVQHPTAEPAPETTAFLRQLEQAPANKRWDLVLAHVRELVAGVLGLDQPDLLTPQQRLFDAGLNSLSAVELVNSLQSSLGQPLPATLVFEFPTIEDLTGYLAREVLFLEQTTASHTEQNKVDDTSGDALVTELEQLSEEEAEALLMKRLKEI
jgi:acyl transferase domain-containing protein